MDCAIRTDDAMVSRHHARIFWGGGGYVVEDLSSANGVYFQEQRVQSHLLKHGDAVRCGSLWLRFVDANQLGAQASSQTPMMQHPGMGAVPSSGPTGNLAAVSGQPGGPGPAAGAPAGGAIAPGAALAALVPSAQNQEAEAEIRVLRRRLEQMQTELRVYRAGKFNPEAAKRMEDLENDLSAIELERDTLQTRLKQAEGALQTESASAKVKRALEISTMAAEAAASLNDVLSSVRIEVMAASGEFEQYAHELPRASFELIRQSLKDAASHCDEARDQLRRLREIAE